MCDKRLGQRIYKEFLKLNSRETNNPVEKWAKKWTDVSLKRTYRWQINILKDATSLAIRKTWIKTTMRYHHTIILMAKIKIPNAGDDV